MRSFLSPLLLALTLAACTSATAIGAKGESLSLFKPADQTLRPGDATRVSVIVRRDALPDVIDLDVSHLPAGVDVVGGPLQIAAGSNFGEFTLQAERDAPLVTSHPVQITARSATGVSVTQTFSVTVKGN